MIAWESVKEHLAAALNGVKGAVNTLDQRRGRQDASHSVIDMVRIDRVTLETMLAAMETSFPTFRHKYVWTWKPHYYRPGLSFYNFPYAFGLLFGTGLYAIYQQRGDDFILEYQDLLASTGEASAEDLAARFGIDLRSLEFWENSLDVIAKHVDRYERL
jgi:oligoendopeptidase F